MRIALLHNTSAGSEDHSDAELSKLIRRAGHEVTHVVSRVRDLTAALQRAACDLVVVAGGDGTVGRAACELAGWHIPLTILPLGTANNTALSLGLAERPKRLVKRWQNGSLVAFDLGFLDDGAVRSRFAEAIGWGLFPLVIAAAKAETFDGSPRKQLERDRALFQTWVGQAPTRHYDIEVDGRDYSGEYALVEVVNVPLIGPRLEISPQSQSDDGLLELVVAGDAERPALTQLAASGELAPGSLRSTHGAKIRVQASEGLLHRDGTLVRHAPRSRSFEISVEPIAVQYLR
ncbi:MAG TPA: diacylglycerol kinase family protein [Polyangiaceae bacterium]